MSQSNLATVPDQDPPAETVLLRKEEYEYFKQQLKDYRRFYKAVTSLLPVAESIENPLNPLEMARIVKKVMKSKGAVSEFTQSLTLLREKYYPSNGDQ